MALEKDNAGKDYDVIIIGGGPAGLAAAIYCYRYNLKTLVVAKEVGGAINEAHLVENYPGTIRSSGFEMMQKWRRHVESFGVEIIEKEVKRIEKTGSKFRIDTDPGEFHSYSLIFCAGMQRRKLGIPGEEEFLGRGVSYCATCDAAFLRIKL